MLQHGMCLQLKFKEEKIILAHRPEAEYILVEDVWQQELGAAVPVASIQNTKMDRVLSSHSPFYAI